jgi:hypothetical protein
VHEDTRGEIGFGQKKTVVGQNMTHKNKNGQTGVKRQQLIKICGLSPGSRTVQEMRQNTSNKTNVFEIECCGSFGQLPTERTRQKKKFLDF